MGMGMKLVTAAPVLLNALVVLHLLRRVHQGPHKVSSDERFFSIKRLNGDEFQQSKPKKNNLPLTDYALTVDKCKCDICKCLLSSPSPRGVDDHTH